MGGVVKKYSGVCIIDTLLVGIKKKSISCMRKEEREYARRIKKSRSGEEERVSGWLGESSNNNI